MKRFALIALALAAFGPAAMADLTPLGEPMEIGSWAQRMNESGVGSFNFIAAKWLVPAGSGFEAPGFRNFSVSGWAMLPSSPVFVSASGTQRTTLDFDMAFLPAKTVPIAFDFYSFLNETRTGAWHCTWNGSAWSFSANGGAAALTRSAFTVPAPGAALLAVFGLSIVGWVKRRFA